MKRFAGRIGSATLVALGMWAMTLSSGCGDGDGGTVPPPLTASFNGSSTATAPNLVRLRSSSASGDMVVLEVALGGPTTSADLYSFAFDLVLSNPSVAAYVAGTAAVGNALTTTGGQTLSVQAAPSGNRLIVGVTKLGGGSGNGVVAAETVVVRVTFRVLAAGTTTVTFSGAVSPQNPTGGPAALDSIGSLVPSVQFDAAPAAITGS